jgi:hypothetical protein
MIDTDVVLKRRWNNLNYATCSYLKKRHRTEVACEAVKFPIEINIGCSKTTQSYQSVKNCIEQSFLEGYFTFNEMLYIAQYALNQCSIMPKAIQTRFPILFIDEAQDTSNMQWELITRAFDNQSLSVRQAFGDVNQAIFQSYGDQKQDRHVFPSVVNVMTIPDSHRFGSSIANLVDPLAVSAQGLVGSFEMYAKNDKQHTIYLFDKNNIDTVLGAYAKKLLQCFTDEELQKNIKLGCYVVGMVHNKAEISNMDSKYPSSIHDYWHLYDPDCVKVNFKPRHLIDVFRLGKNDVFVSKNSKNFVDYIAVFLKRIISANSTNYLSFTGKSFNTISSILLPTVRQQFRYELLTLIQMPFDTESEWDAVVIKIKEILRRNFNITSINHQSIFAWTPNNIILERDIPSNASDKNIYNYVDSKTGRQVLIHLASIHSVKGRTHLATMVVETFWHDSNIKSIIPWLCRTPHTPIGQRNEMRLKCQYVALTRARGLICIALPKESVSKDQAKLLNTCGWNVVIL